MHTRRPRQMVHRLAGHMNSEHSGHFSTAGGQATCQPSGQLQGLASCWAWASGSPCLCTCRHATSTSSGIELVSAELTPASYITAAQGQQQDAAGPGWLDLVLQPWRKGLQGGRCVARVLSWWSP